MPVNLAVIGAGRWGANLIRTIDRLPGTRLGRVATRKPRAESDIPKGCEITNDWQDLLSARDIDGIVLAVPTPVQVEIAAQTIAAGIPTFLEKPMALEIATAEGLREAAVAGQVPVLIDHIYLFHPAYRAMRAACGDNIVRVDSTGGNAGPFRSEIPPLWDWGPHDITMSLDLLNEFPSEITARSETGLGPSNSGTVYDVTMTFPSGAIAHSIFGNGMQSRIRRLVAKTADQTFVFDDQAPDQLVLQRNGRSSPITHADEPSLDRAILEFASAIQDGQQPLRALDLAVDSVRVLAAIRQQI